MSIEDANTESNPISASASSCSTAEDVLNEIKSWIQSDENNDSAKFYSDAVNHIKSKVKRDLFCLEATWVERQYVKTVLEMWLRQSLKRAFEHLEDEAADISMEMSVILNELNLINSFEDIHSKRIAATSRLNYWCNGGSLHESPHFKCRYLQLILEQRDLFSTMPRFIFLVSSYLKQFKTSCTLKIFSRCLNDIAKDEISGESNINFIFSLNEFFEIVNENIKIQNVLKENILENYVTETWDDEGRTGQDSINKLVEIIANSNAAIGKELPQQWFDLMKSGRDWTPQLQLLTKEACKKFLLPLRTEISIKDEDGRKIIFVYGTTVFISTTVGEMLKLKQDNPDVQEIQIIGLTSVHVDCDLELKDWHGVNASIVTHKLYVDGDEVCWNVSGKNGNHKVAEGLGTDQAGESGGNVHVIYDEIINAERWTIVCDGGDGSDRLNVGDNEIEPGGENQKWSKIKFEKAFPSMSKFDTEEEAQSTVSNSESAVKAVLETLEKILPKENRTEGSDIQADHTDSFFIKGIAKGGSRITASFYRSLTKRQTLILCQGSKDGPGEGGFGGTIKFECTGGHETLLKVPNVPFVGKDKREATAVRMGVYEATGTDGFMGIAVGDVGFIHNLDTSLGSAEDNLVGNYIGFDNDVRLKMECSEEKPTRKPSDPEINFYAKLNKKMYASIAPCDYWDFAQVQPLHLEAVKKKAIVRENLTQYLAQVNERKLMVQSLQTLLSNPLEHESSSIDELINQMENKEAQLHQLLSQYEQGLEKIGSVKCVKPALKTKTDDVNYASDTSPTRIIGRRPVDFRSEPSVDIRCLDILPTIGGVNNVFHCIFGRVTSRGLYVCNNTNTLRKRLAKFIRNKENQTKIAEIVVQFVLRMKNSYLSDFPVTCGKKAAYTVLTNEEKEKFNWQEEAKSELFDEYAKFVESPSSVLDLTELKMLAEIHYLTIHVYEEQSTHSFKFKETLNPGYRNQHFILFDGSGEWQRLEANLKLEKFCETLDYDLFECHPIQTDSFQMLMEWLETHHTSENVINYLKNLNPENGDTPDDLFRLLLGHLEQEVERSRDQEIDLEITDDHPIAHDLYHLAESVLEYNNRNISPIFYLSIVKVYNPQEWKCYFLMLELFDRRTTIPNDEDLMNKLSLGYLCDIDDPVLQTVASIKKKIAERDSSSALDQEMLLRLTQMLLEIIDEHQLSELQELPLSGWIYELKSKMWETEFDRLPSDLKEKEHKKLMKEAIHMLLELEFKEGDGFSDEFIEGIEDLKSIVTKLQDNLYPGKNNTYQKPAQRKVEEIISMMMNDIENENLLKRQKYSTMLNDIKIKVEKSKMKSENKEERKIKELIKEWQTNGLKLNDESVVEFLYVYDYAVQQVCTKEDDEHKFQLRDTQRVAITTLLIQKRKTTLTQVSTGEGKSLIVTGVAIAFALSQNKDNKNQKIDVITSNDMLALRDSNLSVIDGGMRNLYEYFNISVSNNCSQSVHNRTKAYNATVVYGQLANFQRDYLMDYFYHHNIRGDRTMDLVIIDEVDCMLLDRGNNTLYLSHDIPGMETLESVYVFIWEKVCTSYNEMGDLILKDSVKNAVLYDLYGAINKKDLKSIHAPLEDNPSETNALWNYLIDKKIIDAQGRLLMKNGIQNINYQENLNPKIAFYFRNVLERERHIRIPDHLIPFVDRHLNSWIDNAVHALELEIDKDYVVDQDRTDTSPDLSPQVIIIDPDTGTDQISTQWDEALHQFIQLKEGCKLTLQSLKTIFISNANYMKKYEKMVGVSGTLGTKTDRTFMERNYKCLYFVIPTAFEKHFHLKPSKVFKSKESWLNAIIKETGQTILTTDRHKARSIVIFCHSIKSVNLVHNRLKNSRLINVDHIHCYTRDFEKFAFESQSLEVGHVIIATNLAGRGTNIKISEELRDNGGLHICLTFLPKNERIEEQAMGRTARNGAPGSGIFILCDESAHSPTGGQKWGAGKFVSMKVERQWQESQRISRFDDDARNIEHEETFFGDFSVHYISTMNELKNLRYDDQEIKIICDSVLDKWALWLDETVDQLELSFSYYMEEFKDFISEFKLPDNKTPNISWLTPVRSVAMAKYLATQKEKPNLSTAADILEPLMKSNDNHCYPSAYYYYAFILFREGLERKKKLFIGTLHTCESILNQHVDMEFSFYRKVTQTVTNRDQTPFCAVDAYKQQKDNTVQLLEYFIGNIRSLLGNNYCSASDLKKAGIEPPKEQDFLKRTAKNLQLFYEKNTSLFQPFGKTGKTKELKDHKICPQKAEKLFHSLVKSTKCTICKINDSDTIPCGNKEKENGVATKSSFETAIEQVAYDYGVSASTLDKTLDLVFKKGLAEKDIEKELEKQIEEKLKTENSILCTRKSFWEKLVQDKALQVIEGGNCFQMKCVIVSEKDCEIEPKLDVTKRSITLDFGFDINYRLDKNQNIYVLFNPTYANRTELKREKKYIFSKQYVKNTLTKEEYLQRKKNFENNKIAKLNIENLKKVNLEQFGRLGRDDFDPVNITDSSDQERIWTALMEQNIIDGSGNLSSEYNHQHFSYPNCPAYEDTVMRLVGRKFAAEIVKRHWLKAAERHSQFEVRNSFEAKQETDEKNMRLKAINVLPLKPYRDMLSDLMAAHVISGTRVTEDQSVNFEEEVQKIEDVDEEERKCIVEFLRSRQPVYAPRTKKCEVVLDFIERDIRNIPKLNNISSELYTFDLVGLNQVIGIRDRKRSWKMVCLTSAISTIIIAEGAALVGVGAFLVYSKILNFGICKNLLFSGGLSDIFYAITTILTRSNFSWADFTRQRLRSAIGKAELIDKIKTIEGLLNSHEKSDQELKHGIRTTIELERRMRQSRTKIMAPNVALLLNNAITQLGLVNQKDELHFHSRLHSQCLFLCDILVAKINKIIDKNSVEIKETLTQLYRLQGQEMARHLADTKIREIASNWFTEGCEWVSEVEITISSKLAEIGINRQMGSLTYDLSNYGIQSIERILEDLNMDMRTVCKTLAHLQTFIFDQNNDNLPPSSMANEFDVEENKRFQKRAITDMKSELVRKAEKVVETLTQKVHEITSDHITQLASTNPKLYAAFLYV